MVFRIWRINYAENVLYVSGTAVQGNVGSVLQICDTKLTVITNTEKTKTKAKAERKRMHETSSKELRELLKILFNGKYQR